MKITAVETISIGKPKGFFTGAQDEFLVTPLQIFPYYQQRLGEHFVGVRGGAGVSRALVRVHTNVGLTGVRSAGVGSGAVVFVIEHHLVPIADCLWAEPHDRRRGRAVFSLVGELGGGSMYRNRSDPSTCCRRGAVPAHQASQR